MPKLLIRAIRNERTDLRTDTKYKKNYLMKNYITFYLLQKQTKSSIDFRLKFQIFYSILCQLYLFKVK